MSVPEQLVKRSSLTPKQFESLVSFLRVRSHEITMVRAASERSTGPVTVGSYARTVVQGRENVKSSILTVILAQWMGFVQADDLRKLLDLVSKGLGELGEQEKERVAALIDILLQKIVP